MAVDKDTLFSKYPAYDIEAVNTALAEELALAKQKVIVLDDDPTGIQTIHSLPVYTSWGTDSIRAGMAEDTRMFFLLTNSRSFSEEQTRDVHKEITNNILDITNDFLLLSRGDSTLRGHYPLETQTVAEEIEARTGKAIDGEIIYPFFPEGGRYTVDGLHYVAYGSELIPAGETEFARDKTFGYKNSRLPEWIEEKTGGNYKAKDVVCISLNELRARDYDGITAKLMGVSGYGKVIVDSIAYEDVKVFVTAFLRAIRNGKRFIMRSAAALVKVLSGVPDRPVLSAEDFRPYGNGNGGLIVVGSHVNKTTTQLETLRKREDIVFLELNQHLVVDPPAFQQEVERVIALANEAVASGKTAAVFTRRDRFDLATGNKEDELRCATTISDKVASIVSRLSVRPSFLIAKGGITSSDIGTKGLKVRRATAMGQILPGVPVWLTGDESLFPAMPYVIFPGNVGDENSLSEAVSKLVGW